MHESPAENTGLVLHSRGPPGDIHWYKLVLLTSTCVGQLVPCRLTISVFPEPGFSCLPHEHTSKRQVHDYIKLSFLKFTFERFDLFMCGLCCVYECGCPARPGMGLRKQNCSYATESPSMGAENWIWCSEWSVYACHSWAMAPVPSSLFQFKYLNVTAGYPKLYR